MTTTLMALRHDRATKIAAHYLELEGGEDFNLRDLLADFMHWCEDVPDTPDFENEHRMAEIFFADERAEEAPRRFRFHNHLK